LPSRSAPFAVVLTVALVVVVVAVVVVVVVVRRPPLRPRTATGSMTSSDYDIISL